MEKWVYKISFLCRFADIDVACDHLDSHEISYQYFSHKRKNPLIDNEEDIWMISIYSDDSREMLLYEKIIWQLSAKNLDILSVTRERLANQDWVSFVQDKFQPIAIENYYIHASHFEPSKDKVNIMINPKQAFGTGEHETTQLCLQGINFLKNSINFQPTNCFDLGSGSGILAIAAYKSLCKNVIASDIDKTSTEICIDNFQLNNVDIPCYHCAGIDHQEIKNSAPFDLVIANILLAPLLELCSEINSILSTNGFIILSGFLIEQEDELVEKYSAHKFELRHTLRKDQWSCLIMQKTS